MSSQAKKLEKGQVAIVFVLGIVALMGFVALAVDGGMIFMGRRRAQTVADAAAMAASQQLANGGTAEEAENAAKNIIISNGFADQSTIDAMVTIAIQDGLTTPEGDDYELVEVTVNAPIETAFVQFVLGDTAQNTVKAVGRIQSGEGLDPVEQTIVAEAGIITMDNCLTTGGHLLEITGGGNSGGIRTFDGDIFMNTPETSGNACAIDPPSSSGNDGIGAVNWLAANLAVNSP